MLPSNQGNHNLHHGGDGSGDSPFGMPVRVFPDTGGTPSEGNVHGVDNRRNDDVLLQEDIARRDKAHRAVRMQTFLEQVIPLVTPMQDNP